MTHIVVLGSTNMDLVTHVEKPPRRGETVTGREFRTLPGGKGANQAIAAAHAGASVPMIGAVGTDSYGPRLRATLELPHPRLRSGEETFVGALAAALGEERPIREALRWAAAASALSVQRPGASASMPYRSEIEAQYTS
ncbi:PfkB family carbohydrate kinase [Streptomyces gilvifuscus]|uniref:PfkB family carbohydrate kinase n=1 Tax=Streptomyces gilvifuscus TaxID=1550617 RepID=A0ABT5FU59_9ACTN|nr:PfkB family carbohydrate kinase [Streptomyces gilvifuscus]MDC2955982.1 PfkB family carbohydrate kinase [Streptomyces gilvifuscus]